LYFGDDDLDEEQQQPVVVGTAVQAADLSDGSSSLSDSEDEWELEIPDAPVPAPFGTRRRRWIASADDIEMAAATSSKKRSSASLPSGAKSQQRRRSKKQGRRGSSGELDPESLQKKPSAAALKTDLDQSDRTALSYQKDQWSDSDKDDKDEEPKKKQFGWAKAGAAIAVMGGVGYLATKALMEDDNDIEDGAGINDVAGNAQGGGAPDGTPLVQDAGAQTGNAYVPSGGEALPQPAPQAAPAPTAPAPMAPPAPTAIPMPVISPAE
jgi:hypothetical protein